MHRSGVAAIYDKDNLGWTRERKHGALVCDWPVPLYLDCIAFVIMHMSPHSLSC